MVALDERMLARRADQLQRKGYCMVPQMVHDFRLELEYLRCRNGVGGRECREIPGGLLLDPKWQHYYDIPSLLARERTVDVLGRLGVRDVRLVNFRCVSRPRKCDAQPWSRRWQDWEEFDVYYFFGLYETRDSGCLRVEPGSHLDANIRYHSWTTSSRFDEASVLVVPGEIVVMNGRLLAGSHPNISGRHHGYLAVTYVSGWNDLSLVDQTAAAKHFPAPPAQWWLDSPFRRQLWDILAPKAPGRPADAPQPPQRLTCGPDG